MDSPQNAAEHFKDTISRSRTQGIFRETFVYSRQSNFFRSIGPAPPVQGTRRSNAGKAAGQGQCVSTAKVQQKSRLSTDQRTDDGLKEKENGSNQAAALMAAAITGRGPWAAPSRPERSNPVCRCGGRGGTRPRRQGASWSHPPGHPWKGGYPPNHRRSASDWSGH